MRVVGYFVLAALTFAFGLCGCATIARWDAKIAAERENMRRACHAQGRMLYSKQIYTGHFVHWCCRPETIDDCHDVPEHAGEIEI